VRVSEVTLANPTIKKAPRSQGSQLQTPHMKVAPYLLGRGGVKISYI